MLTKRIKTRACVQNESIDDVLSLYYEKFCDIAKVQLTMEEFRLPITRKNYDLFCKCCSDERLPPHEFCSGLMAYDETKDPKKGSKVSELHFRYFHRIQVEFLAAKSITGDLDKFSKEMDRFYDSPTSHEYDLMLHFIVGILWLIIKLARKSGPD